MPIEDMDKWQGSSSAFRGGLGVSEAARLTSLILAKAYAEVTKTVQTPLRLLANAPGLSPIDSILRVLAGGPLISGRCKSSSSSLSSSSGVVAGVIVKLKDAQRERVLDTETYFLSRRISTEHMQSQ